MPRALFYCRIFFAAMLVAVMLPAFSSLARAEDPQPGASCSAAQTGHFYQVGGPEEAGGGHFLVCNGTTWNKSFAYNADGVTLPTLVKQISCLQGSALIYDATTGGMRCDVDTMPDAFDFVDESGKTLSATETSNIVTIAGLGTGVNVPVTINGDGSPSFRINGGAWVTSGTVKNGDTVQLKLTTSANYNTAHTVSISIGDYSDSWTVTTYPEDLTPDAFSFTDLTNKAKSTQYTSNTVTINGINNTVNVSISGTGSPQFRIDGGAWVTSGTLVNGQTLQLRLTSSASFSTTNTATVTVGTLSRSWDVTTLARDITPASCSFTNLTMQPYNSLRTASAITISSINDGTPVSVTGDGSPQISINGGGWTTSGTIYNNQTLNVRLTSANSQSTTRSADIDVGTCSSTWDVTTYDKTPTAFDFVNKTGQAKSTWITSGALTISGINTSTPVSISGAGQFRIAGGSWVTSGNITNNQTLELRLYSSASFSTAVSTTVTVGTVSDAWSVTTLARDVYPDAFSFTNLTVQEWNTLLSSSTPTITGINDGATVSVTGDGSPQIRIYNGSSWGSWTTSTTLYNGYKVQVRLTSANSSYVTRTATVDIGGRTADWSVRTKDITPAAFNFANLSNQARSTWIYSSTLTISGIDVSTPVSISGTNAQFQIAGGSWVTSGNITNGQTLRLRRLTGSGWSTNHDQTVTVGTVSDFWRVTTLARDTTPNAFSFTDLTNQVKNTLVYSNTITISGINDGTTVIQSGQGSPQFSINGGSWVTSGTITNGQTLRLRLTTPNADNSTYGVTVDVGGVTDTWYATTRWTYSWYAAANWSSCSGSYSTYGSWYYTAGCSVSCGGGTRPKRQDCRNNSTGSQTQTVQCRRSDNTVVADANCSGTKPSTTRSCTMPCQYGSYRTGSDSCNTQACCTPGPTCVYGGWNGGQPAADDCGTPYPNNDGKCYTNGYQVDNRCVSNGQYKSATDGSLTCSGGMCKSNNGSYITCGTYGWNTYGWSWCWRKWCK